MIFYSSTFEMGTEDPPRPEAPCQADAGAVQVRMMEALRWASALLQDVLGPRLWVCVLGVGMWGGCASEHVSALTHSHWAAQVMLRGHVLLPQQPSLPAGSREPQAGLGCGAASAPSAPCFCVLALGLGWSWRLMVLRKPKEPTSADTAAPAGDSTKQRAPLSRAPFDPLPATAPDQAASGATSPL